MIELNHEAITTTLSEMRHFVPERVRRVAAAGLADTPDLEWVRSRIPQVAAGGFSVMAGPNGTGKTIASYYACIALMHAGIEPFAGNMHRITAPEVQAAVLGKDIAWLWNSYKVVLLDDLGAEYESKGDWTASQWDMVFDGLYRECRIVFISTNLKPEQLQPKYGPRIWSRLNDQGKGWLRPFTQVMREGVVG